MSHALGGTGIAIAVDRHRRNQRSATSGQLAATYGFTDIDGSQPNVWQYNDDVEDGLSPNPGDIFKLSRILGHSNIAVTEAHDAHLLKEDLVAANQQVKIPVALRPGGNVVTLQPRREMESA